MTNDEVFPHYKDLWKRTPLDDLYIHYEGRSLNGEAGYFQHDGQGNGNPRIVIIRAHYAEPDDEPSMIRADGEPVDLAAEMITLAHEYGHYLSFSERTPRAQWHAYYRALQERDRLVSELLKRGCNNVLTHRDRLKQRLSGRDKTLIIEEETLAWTLGRQFVPPSLLEEYARRAVHGVHCHRYRLGIDPLWPEDSVA